jgi:hypothetical protein
LLDSQDIEYVVYRDYVADVKNYVKGQWYY